MLRKFVKDIAAYSPSQFLPALTAIITTPILTRLFPPAEYGYWALAGSAAAFLVSLAVSGFGSAAIRYFPVYRTNKTLDVFFATIGGSVACGIVIVAGLSSVVLLLLRPLVSPPLFRLMPLVILLFVGQSVFSVLIAVLRAEGKSAAYTSFQLVTNYGGLGIGLFLVVADGLRVDGLLWGTFLSIALVLPFLLLMVVQGNRIDVRKVHRADALRLWSYAWPLTLGNVAMWGLRLSDLSIIGHYGSERDVGLYSVSYNISAKSIELLVSLFLLSVSPLIMTTWENQGREATERTLTMITRVYIVICLPAAIGVTVLARPFVAALTSPSYYEGSKIVGYVVLSSFAWGLAHIAMMGLLIKKKARILAGNQVVAAAVHIGLQLLFVPRFGYVASAISTLCGYTLLLALEAAASRRLLTWRLPVDTLRNVVIASTGMGLTAWGIYAMAGARDRPSLGYLALSVALAMLVYAGGLWWLGEVRASEKQAVVRLWARARNA